MKEAGVFSARSELTCDNCGEEMPHGECPRCDADKKQSFYVRVNGSVVVKIEKDGGKWYEELVAGDKNIAQDLGVGGKTYMSYLTKNDIMTWLSGDYNDVDEIDPADLDFVSDE